MNLDAPALCFVGMPSENLQSATVLSVSIVGWFFDSSKINWGRVVLHLDACGRGSVDFML